MKGENFLFSEKSLSAEKTERGDPLGFSNIHSVAKQQKIEGGPFGGKNFPEKKSHSAKKIWKGALWDFPTSILSQNQKNRRGPFGEKNFPEKIGMGDPLVSPVMVCYAGKQEKPFWFSSLDQIVQFGAIIFCRTILVSSCGLKRRLKIWQRKM